MTITGLSIFPIKSLRGISLDSASVEERGFRYDRRWMLVDTAGVCLTQRSLPHMALVTVALGEGEMRVSAPSMPTMLTLPLQLEHGATRRVQVWNDTVDAFDAGDEAGEWFAQALHLPCRLVFMPERSRRPVDPLYARDGDTVSFADGYPMLLLSEVSLSDLNSRLASPIAMNRFRPNIVVMGCEAFEEDLWQTIRIGGVVFDVVKPCARCTIPTIDLATGIPGKEPSATLATYRTRNHQVYFGQNLIPRGTGTITVNDAVEVLARKLAHYDVAG